MIYAPRNREFAGCGGSYFVGKRVFCHTENKKQLSAFMKYPGEFVTESDYSSLLGWQIFNHKSHKVPLWQLIAE